MKKALYISTQVPTYHGPAGNKTAMDNLKNLSNDFSVDVVLVCSSSHKVVDNEYESLNINLLKIYRLSKLEKYLNALKNICLIPPKFGLKRNSKIFSYISSLSVSKKYAVVFFEFGESVVYIDAIITGPKLEISLPDILTQWHLRQAWYFGVFSMPVFKYEQKQYKKVDVILVQSTKDRDLFKALFGHKNVRLIEPHISSFVRNVRRSPQTIERHSVLFWGAMNRSENTSGLIWFVENCWAEVSSRLPSAKLYVVGLEPTQVILSYSSENVIVTGYVDDPTPYFELAHVGIAPLFQGAGIKVKVLEMLRTGMTVVSTSVGAEGIEQNTRLVIANKNDFSLLLIDSLRDSKH